MPATTDLRNAIRRLVADGSGLDLRKVIRTPVASSRAPMPKKPFSTIQLIGEMTAGTASIQYVENGQRVREDVRAEYSIQFVGSGAHERARMCRLFLSSDRAMDQADAAGISIHTPGELRDISDIPFSAPGGGYSAGGVGFEERAQFDLPIGYSRSVAYTQGMIDSSEIVVSLSEGDVSYEE